DGSGELAIVGPEFFRNVWINEVVINDIEVRPLGVDSLEFDDEGTATISFVTIRPGTFVLRLPGTTSDSQQAVFNVKRAARAAPRLTPRRGGAPRRQSGSRPGSPSGRSPWV